MRRLPALCVLLAVGVAACQSARPRPVAFGEESCTHCHMTVTDGRFAAEAITSAGRIYLFDDVGCLASWLAESGTPVRSTWVAHFTSPGQWIPADAASYLQTTTLRTPMASGLLALRGPAETDSLATALGGTRLTWDEVRAQSHTHAVAS